MGRKRRFTGENFWGRGYFVSTVGLGEGIVRKYIQDQEKDDTRLDRLDLEFPEASEGGS
jgi:putative transposase